MLSNIFTPVYCIPSCLEAMLPPCVHRVNLIHDKCKIILDSGFNRNDKTISELHSTGATETYSSWEFTYQCPPDCCALPQAAAARRMTAWSNLLESSFAESSPLWHISETAIFTPTIHTHTCTHSNTHTHLYLWLQTDGRVSVGTAPQVRAVNISSH